MKLDTRNDYAARMLRVLNHVQARLDETIDLGELARLACFSVSHFHRVFKGMLGETIMEHVRRIRLERAYMELMRTSAQVTEIAFAAGYESLEAFSRSFRASFGLSPSQCRAQEKSLGWTERFAHVPSGVHYGAGEIVEILFDDTGAARMNVRIENLPERRLAMVRETGPYMQSARRAWARLCAWAGPLGLLGPHTLFIGISHDDPTVTAPRDIRYDAAISLSREVTATAPVTLGVLPAGEHAVIIHQGPYDRMEETYKAVMGEWLPQSGRGLGDGPSFEVYRNDPERTPPEELLTDVCVPLR